MKGFWRVSDSLARLSRGIVIMAVLCGAGLIRHQVAAAATEPGSVQPTGAGAIYLPYVAGGAASSDAAAVFPDGLAVASPLRMAPATTLAGAGADGDWVGGYAIATAHIRAVLMSTAPVSTLFDPAAFLGSGVNAACYGPRLSYHHHPDGASGGGSMHELPPGDLGIWLETDVTGDACAAAQLNARLNAAEQQSEATLVVLASLLSAARDAGIPLPFTGGTVDLTLQMNAAGIADVGFASATLTYDTILAAWDYAVDFTYTEPSSGHTHHIVVAMAHTPSPTAPLTEYRGSLTYRVNDYRDAGNCASGTPGPVPVTINGSLKYDRAAVADLRIQSRVGTFCGHDVDGLAGDQVDTAGAWTDNFSIFAGNFDPDTAAGTYAYAWQAGLYDRASRVLNIGINAHKPLDGEAYYGFGSRLQEDDDGVVGVEGLYCNWAAPGNLPGMQAYAQRQFVRFVDTTGQFEVPAGGSDIHYAPTNTCQYDGSGSFWYDRNLNSFGDEGVDDVIVTPASTNPLDLMVAVDTDGDGMATLIEAIAARGYTLPVTP